MPNKLWEPPRDESENIKSHQVNQNLSMMRTGPEICKINTQGRRATEYTTYLGITGPTLSKVPKSNVESNLKFVYMT